MRTYFYRKHSEMNVSLSTIVCCFPVLRGTFSIFDKFCLFFHKCYVRSFFYQTEGAVWIFGDRHTIYGRGRKPFLRKEPFFLILQPIWAVQKTQSVDTVLFFMELHMDIS